MSDEYVSVANSNTSPNNFFVADDQDAVAKVDVKRYADENVTELVAAVDRGEGLT